jgi:hypothetical protein
MRGDRTSRGDTVRVGSDRHVARYPPPTEDRVAPGPLRAVGIRQLLIAYWLVVVALAVLVRYPEAFRDANRSARANAALDVLDLQSGGGNSVIPDQRLLFEARGLIPRDGTFAVALGPRQEGWTDLTATYAETFLRSFLLPRRAAGDAPWILCFACDRGTYPGARVAWEGDDGLSILERPQ